MAPRLRLAAFPRAWRRISLRTTLLAFVLGSAVLLGGGSLIMAYRLTQGAALIREPSHGAVAMGLTLRSLDSAVGGAVDSLHDIVFDAALTGGSPTPGRIAWLRDEVVRLGDSAWAMRGATALRRNPPAVHQLIARAVAGESRTLEALAAATRDLEAGRLFDAAAGVHETDSMLEATMELVDSLHRSLMIEAFEREQDLRSMVGTTFRVVGVSLVGALLLAAAMLVVFQRRVYRPLNRLDAALASIAQGAFDVELPDGEDELGRLNRQVNRTAVLLQDRADAERRRARNLLERLGRVLDESANEIFIFDAGTLRFTQVSEGAKRNLGFEAEDLNARTPVDLLPDLDELRFRQILRPLQEGERERVVLSSTHRRADGSTYPVEIRIQLSRREQPPVFVAVAQDITERLRLQAERDRVFELAADILVTGTLDGTDLVFTRVSPAGERVLGCVADNVIGRSAADLAHPNDAERVRKGVEELAAGRRLRDLTVQVDHVDGGRRWISWNADPPVDRVVYAVGRDVTAQVEATRREVDLRFQIERSAREWTLTFDALDSPLILVDAQGVVLRMNNAASRLAGVESGKAVGRRLTEVAQGPVWRRGSDLVQRVLETGRPASVQAGGRSGRVWDLQCVPAPDLGAGAAILIAHDVTSLLRLQESLRRNETMAAMGSLLAGVVHEVRNPLFSMTATLDAFEARHGSAAAGSHLQVLRKQMERLRRLMQQLLEYGKPQSLELTTVALREVVTQAVEASAVEAAEHQVGVKMQCDGDLPPVRVDRFRLAQVFTNLILNAVEHAPVGSGITLDARTIGEDGQFWVEVRVLDRGSGFTPEDIPRVFEPFFTRRRGGTGLGLALVRRIVEEHGGVVNAGNRPEGGAVVTVRLPVSGG